MIKLTNVNKIYGKGDSQVHALKDVNLELPEGKFIAVIGKSGSGKSTLMNIIGALDSPTSGEINSNGAELTTLKENELAKYRNEKIGYIFQSFYLEPTFTVLENVAMPLTIAGVKRDEREKKAKEIIEKLKLTDKTDKKASELSGGQKQRVSIARALVSNPEIILADEPTGNLDSQNGAEVISLLQSICNDGKTVVLVTHNIDDAKKTDLMVEIKDGVIASITENSLEVKMKAQKASDYDSDGNYIGSKVKTNEAESAVVENVTENVVTENAVVENVTENVVTENAEVENVATDNAAVGAVVENVTETKEEIVEANVPAKTKKAEASVAKSKTKTVKAKKV
ncbi:MAG: ABC transporter ATP-binding protein, partial [Clostridia bacterium]